MFRITANWLAGYKVTGDVQRHFSQNIRITVNRSGLIRLDFYFKDEDGRQHFHLLGKYRSKPTKDFLEVVNEEYARLNHGLLHGAQAFWKVEAEKEWIRNHPRQDPHIEWGPLPAKYQAELDAHKFQAIANDYCDWFESSGKISHENERALVRRLVNGTGNAPGMGDRRPDSITGADIQRILDEIAKDHPTTANAVKRLCSRLWRWMKRRGLVESKAAVEDLEAKAPPPRDRLITESELRRLVNGCHPYFLAVVLNPLRLVEHCRMHWDDIDEGLNASVRVKGGRRHIQPLTEAYTACSGVLRRSGGHLFTGRHGRGHILRTSLSDISNRWIKDCGVQGAVAHDLRSCFGSWQERHGTPFEVWDACLAHKKKGLHGVYGLYSYLDEKRLAIEAWDSYINSLVKQ